MNVLHSSHRITLTLLCSAGLFIVLGGANFILGANKVSEYEELLRNVQPTIAAPPPEPFGLPLPRTQLEPELVLRQRIVSRIRFYELVVIGGKSLLAIAGILLLATLTIRLHETQKRT